MRSGARFGCTANDTGQRSSATIAAYHVSLGACRRGRSGASRTPSTSPPVRPITTGFVMPVSPPCSGGRFGGGAVARASGCGGGKAAGVASAAARYSEAVQLLHVRQRPFRLSAPGMLAISAPQGRLRSYSAIALYRIERREYKGCLVLVDVSAPARRSPCRRRRPIPQVSVGEDQRPPVSLAR